MKKKKRKFLVIFSAKFFRSFSAVLIGEIVVSVKPATGFQGKNLMKRNIYIKAVVLRGLNAIPHCAALNNDLYDAIRKKCCALFR